MSSSVFALVLNGTIIILLIATIVYASRLSVHITAFRNSRKELDKLIKDLGAQIERADQAIGDMREASKGAGKKLQDSISGARAITDELMMMTETGNALSARLEKLSGRVKTGQRDMIEQQAQPLPKKKTVRSEPPKGRLPVKPPASLPSAQPSSFAIRDTEFDRDEESGGDEGLGSQAERELYEALHGRKPGNKL